MSENYDTLDGQEFDSREKAIEHDFRARYRRLISGILETSVKDLGGREANPEAALTAALSKLQRLADFADAPLKTKQRFVRSVKDLDVWMDRIISMPGSCRPLPGGED